MRNSINIFTHIITLNIISDEGFIFNLKHYFEELFVGADELL